MTQYVEILDKDNPRNPKLENIASELDKKIAEIEQKSNVKLVTFAFLGEGYVRLDGEKGNEMYAIPHDKIHKYMLHFR